MHASASESLADAASRIAPRREIKVGCKNFICGFGGIGRRVRFRFLWSQGCEGSSPLTRTKKTSSSDEVFFSAGSAWTSNFTEIQVCRRLASIVVSRANHRFASDTPCPARARQRKQLSIVFSLLTFNPHQKAGSKEPAFPFGRAWDLNCFCSAKTVLPSWNIVAFAPRHSLTAHAPYFS